MVSKLAEAVDAIQQEFKKRFGLEVTIYLHVYDTSDVEEAEEVANIVAKELGMCSPEHKTSDDYAWIIAERNRVGLTIFYPCEQKERVAECTQQ